MAEDVFVGVEGNAGVIRLTRPKAINALTPEMIGTIVDALTDWADDDTIKIVLIEGEGDKGFCAGGDVRTMRDLVLAGREARVFDFFAAEYEMNGVISGYDKPIIALQHGVVMGGGIGLSSHARYRLATTTSQFAMPEAAIGFFCDVGVNAILYQAPEARALAFLLSGQSVGAADAIALGLADVAVPPKALASIRARLIEAARASEPDTAISAIMGGESVNAGVAGFCLFANSLTGAFSKPETSEIIAELHEIGIDGDPGASAMAERMAAHCPTSLEAIVLSHRQARRLRDTKAVLEMDLRLARHMALRPDFAEGVRAVLVDKDRAPKWEPAKLQAVDRKTLEGLISG